ncbi:hypothetical protein [Streptomyces sp. NPDC049585]|uniref:hypothetical protein n=1 Tax=Streptomyces sp. NPDC049585 TaxID=3155154 RepID=UPI0034167341
MAVASGFLDYAKVLAWPVVVVGIVWIFRREFVTLLGRLEAFEGFGFRAKFKALDEQRRQATKRLKKKQEAEARRGPSEPLGKEAVPSSPPPPPAPAPPPTVPSPAGPPPAPEPAPSFERSPALERAEALASVDPLGAVRTAWAYVQEAARRLLGDNEMSLPPGFEDRMEVPLAMAGLSRDSADLYAQLRRLGQLSEYRADLDGTTAREYIESCEVLLKELAATEPQHPPGA